MSAPLPKSGWKASPDVPLRDLLIQMTGLGVDFVEIAIGDTTVSIAITPTSKQPGLRDVVANYKART